MSMFRIQSLNCPSCGASVDFNVVFSVNADRRPDLRVAIIDGTFQRGTCAKCRYTFRLEPELTYLDVGGDQCILVRPVDKLSEWPDLEEHARALFDTAYGDTASAVAREMGRNLQARVTFGWAAFREKLLCVDYGLDDVTLEMMKMSLIRGLGDAPIADDTELRLGKMEGDQLVLGWIQAATERAIESMNVPRSLYDDIVADPTAWQLMRAELSAGPFVDVHRLLVEPAEAE